MIIDNFKIWKRQGNQFIPDVSKPVLPEIFRGRPEISTQKIDNEQEIVDFCPTEAISAMPMRIDLGKCVFCGECALRFPHKIKFTNDYKIATNHRSRLVIAEGETLPVGFDEATVRSEIKRHFGGSLLLRQVSAGGNNASELELNACVNVNFDMSRFGIDWVASPRHADGLVITGAIGENMATALALTYEAIAKPKIIILAGTDAISGGIFAGSNALKRDFLTQFPIDLYVPGQPIHPLTFVNGILKLTKK